MKKIKLSHLALFAALTMALSANAQNSAPYHPKKSALTETELKRWSHLDLAKDSIPGMSVDKAYAELLKNKTGKPVIVGIIDSGVDVEHEDLKSVIWTNKKEIAGNGIDDDKNGYIDDIHGWNFLGNITKENLEMARIVQNKNLADEATYTKAKAEYDKKLQEAQQGKKQLSNIMMMLSSANGKIAQHLGKTEYTLDEVNAIQSTDQSIIRSKAVMQQMLSYGYSIPDLKKNIKEEYDGYVSTIANSEVPTDYRKILGDNPNDINDKIYGNGNVMGPDKNEILHGTHVAGIVAQVRNNNIGGDGVANNVEIMAIRAVPNGDEYDKDIALGIRYAVDNGAKVINGSFGKSFSPHKEWVYDAIKYAESKDVLIVHAAGNDSKNIDIEENFPNDSKDKKTEFANNMITVGALNYEYGNEIVADFSNYGKINVDVFAPGVKIYATTPNNEYKYEQGTSMAAPNVAGVAALIRSHYPTLSAKQVKQILMDSGTTITNKVVTGENRTEIPFANTCKSGKIVNAYNALKMAEMLATKSDSKIKTSKKK